jgi:phosphoenolpyruvate carboxykinase (ATP)
MPRNPDEYAKLLGEKMEKHGTRVFLLNTGWSGGPYGVGERMDINLTRRLVDAALNGEFNDVEVVEDKIFHLHVPVKCKNIDSQVLWPKNTWVDKDAFDQRANKLASEFREHFEKTYGDKDLSQEIIDACPGK